MTCSNSDPRILGGDNRPNDEAGASSVRPRFRGVSLPGEASARVSNNATALHAGIPQNLVDHRASRCDAQLPRQRQCISARGPGTDDGPVTAGAGAARSATTMTLSPLTSASASQSY
jgi:hypothetical protein